MRLQARPADSVENDPHETCKIDINERFRRASDGGARCPKQGLQDAILSWAFSPAIGLAKCF